jgi:hypothetical protein
MGRAIAAPTTEEMTEGGERLEAEGTYHFLVLICKDQEMPHNSDYFDGYSAKLQVFHGPHEGKEIGILLQDGSDNKDGGAFARKKQTAFFIATNVMSIAQMGQSVEINESIAAGAQVVATVKLGKVSEKTGKQYLDIEGLKIYHVDDPRVKDVPKDTAMLKSINAAYRHEAKYFEPILPKHADHGGSKPPKNPPASPAADEPVNEEGL